MPGRGPGLRRGHPAGLPDHPAVRRGDQGRSRRQGRGLRAPLVRERVQGTPARGPGAGGAPASPRPVLLIRPLLSRPDTLTFYLCWSPEGQPATMTFFITIAGRRWACEETFKTGKDTLGWDQSQVRTWD